MKKFVMIFSASIAVMILAFFVKYLMTPPSIEQEFVSQMSHRCYSMHGTLYYDKQKQIAECNSKVAFRYAKTIWSENFSNYKKEK